MPHLVVAYDVVGDHERARLLKFLRGYLDHVQKSVFEGPVPDSKVQALRSGIAKRIDPRTDSVRIYHLCGRCRPATEIIGSGVYVDDEDQDVLV
jgi:CRISPR-associated protein Cas2